MSLEQVFYNCHTKVSHTILRHTSHRTRSIIEHAILGVAVCTFCIVILSHRTFVHREDIASISRDDIVVVDDASLVSCYDDNNIQTNITTAINESSNSGIYNGRLFGFINESRGVSMYSIIMQILWSGYAYVMTSKDNNTTSWRDEMMGKKIPVTCLKSISGFRTDADVNHILLQYDHHIKKDGASDSEEPTTSSFGSRAFTTTRGINGEQIISGMPTNTTDQYHSCTIGDSSSSEVQSKERHSFLFGFVQNHAQQQKECPNEILSFLDHHGYLSIPYNGTSSNIQQTSSENNQYDSPIIYSYSHSQGLLRLPPNLQHIHNISTQFIVASTSDVNCFGEPLARSIIFRFVGADTPILNWILGLQNNNNNKNGNNKMRQKQVTISKRPRFVYHHKTKKELDLNIYDMDRYAFSSKSSDDGTTTPPMEYSYINKLLGSIQKYPLYRFLRFLSFKLLVLLSTLLIFFLTTSLVSFTFQETQDRMLEFTLQLQTRVRAQMPLGGLILGHVLENLVFIPIMVGMVFFLIEFYGGDKFLAFNVLSMVWICEVFSAISIRSAQGMHFFPRVFFLYFTLFHVYFFSFPIGFTYASLASTIMFLFHTMVFFLNRYELPALHAGLITPLSPRRGSMSSNNNNVNVLSPTRIQASPNIPQMQRRHLQPPQIPQMPRHDEQSNVTAPTAALSAMNTIDFTPNSEDDQGAGLPPPHSGLRAYVNAATNSLESIRSLASVQSLGSIADNRTSPNLIFHGGYSFNDSVTGDDDSEEDSYNV